MAFNAEEFMEDVTWDKFDVLKKSELMTLAMHLNLQVKHAMRKKEIKNKLIDRLLEDDLLDEFDLDNKIEDDGADSAVKLKRLELQQEMEMAKLKLEQERLKIKAQERKEKLQLEQERLKIEQDRFAMEKEIKLKEIEARVQIEKEKLEKQFSSTSSTQSGFDATKNIRLVPKFEEKEVDKYFLHFEKIAESLKWPEESLDIVAPVCIRWES